MEDDWIGEIIFNKVSPEILILWINEVSLNKFGRNLDDKLIKKVYWTFLAQNHLKINLFPFGMTKIEKLVRNLKLYFVYYSLWKKVNYTWLPLQLAISKT